LTLTDGSKVCVGGTVAGARHHGKIVEVDGFDIDVPISDNLAFYRYHDKPGVVGIVGNLLGGAGINIGGMQVSRDETDHSLMVLSVDSAVPADLVDTISEQIGAHSGRFVSLPS
jgi:D-3-phosphoglycerate dehydrogenase